MKALVIIAVAVILLLVAGTFAVMALSNQDANTGNIACSSCGGKCSEGNNCGVSTCGAVSGTGNCGCKNGG